MSKQLLPDAVLDKHIAALGMTGSGKTSIVKAAIVEPDLDEDRRVIMITPKDDLWGLRLSKTGKSKGYDIPIFGGYHEDYPLRVSDAELLAETYATMKGSAIFCTAKLSGQDRARWFAAFAETLLRKNKGWVRVWIDEAHVFMPQQGGGRGGGAIPLAMHAGNELVSQGRSQGLRIVLASQRSAKLHNDALTQCPCLIAMMLMAPPDRDAVKAWIEDQADPHVGKEIIASLAQLKAGEAWVWAPRAKMLERIQFPRPKTYDSSAAPDDDADDAPKLAPVSLDTLQGKLAKVEAERKANDPAALKAEIVKLQRDLAGLQTQASKAAEQKADADPEALDKAEKRGFERAKKEAVAAAKKLIEEAVAEIEKDVNTFDEAVKDAVHQQRARTAERLKALVRERQAVTPQYAPLPRQAAPPLAPRAPQQAPARLKAPAAAAPQAADSSLAKGERIVLTAVAQHPNGCTREQLTVITGYKRSSRDTYLQRLGAAGLVEARNERVVATDAGVAALGADYQPLPTGQALRDHMLPRLPQGERRVLEVLIQHWPNSIQRDVITEATGYQRSSRDTYLQRLSSRELVDSVGPGAVKASDLLFDEIARVA